MQVKFINDDAADHCSETYNATNFQLNPIRNKFEISNGGVPQVNVKMQMCILQCNSVFCIHVCTCIKVDSQLICTVSFQPAKRHSKQQQHKERKRLFGHNTTTHSNGWQTTMTLPPYFDIDIQKLPKTTTKRCFTSFLSNSF